MSAPTAQFLEPPSRVLASPCSGWRPRLFCDLPGPVLASDSGVMESSVQYRPKNWPTWPCFHFLFLPSARHCAKSCAYFTTFEEDQSSSEEPEVERMEEVLDLEVGPRSVTNAFIFVTVISVGHCPEEKSVAGVKKRTWGSGGLRCLSPSLLEHRGEGT